MLGHRHHQLVRPNGARADIRRKTRSHDSPALAIAEEDGFDLSVAHRAESHVVRNNTLLGFSTPIRSRQAVTPM